MRYFRLSGVRGEGGARGRGALRRFLGFALFTERRPGSCLRSDDVERGTLRPPRRRLGGVVGGLDRFFPLLWIGFYLLLPVSGWATEMFDVLVRPAAGSLGAAVIARRRTCRRDRGQRHRTCVHRCGRSDPRRRSDLSAEDSLIALTARRTRCPSRWACCWCESSYPPDQRAIGGRRSRRSSCSSGSCSRPAPGTGRTFRGATSSRHSSRSRSSGPDSRRARSPLLWAAVTGSLVALLAATRSFELVAVVLAWGIVALGLRLVRLEDRAPSARRAAGRTRRLRGHDRRRLPGHRKARAVLPVREPPRPPVAGRSARREIAETPTLSIALIPVKLVQLFVDPCYLSLCSHVRLRDGRRGRQNVDLWSLPLAIQLPALLLLPLCIVGVGVLVVRSARRRATARIASVRPLAEMTVAATGLVLGYAGEHPHRAEPPALRVRARLHAAVAADRGRGSRARRDSRSGASSLVAVPHGSLPRSRSSSRRSCSSSESSQRRRSRASRGLPRIEGKHLGAVVYSARCAGQACDVRVAATTTRRRLDLDPRARRP